MAALDIIRYVLFGGASALLAFKLIKAIKDLYEIKKAPKMRITRKDNGRSIILDREHHSSNELEELVEFMK